MTSREFNHPLRDIICHSQRLIVIMFPCGAHTKKIFCQVMRQPPQRTLTWKQLLIRNVNGGSSQQRFKSNLSKKLFYAKDWLQRMRKIRSKGLPDSSGNDGVDVGRGMDEVEVLAAALADQPRKATVVGQVVADSLPQPLEGSGNSREIPKIVAQ